MGGRYVDWILTTPLMLWDVLALAGAPSDDILAAVGVDVLMIGFGAVGAQTPSAQKWVFFVCGMICFGHVVKVLLKYTTVSTAGKEAQSLYCKVAYMTIVLWTLYPLVWIVSEGGRLVSPEKKFRGRSPSPQKTPPSSTYSGHLVRCLEIDRKKYKRNIAQLIKCSKIVIVNILVALRRLYQYKGEMHRILMIKINNITRKIIEEK